MVEADWPALVFKMKLFLCSYRKMSFIRPGYPAFSYEHVQLIECYKQVQGETLLSRLAQLFAMTTISDGASKSISFGKLELIVRGSKLSLTLF